MARGKIDHEAMMLAYIEFLAHGAEPLNPPVGTLPSWKEERHAEFARMIEKVGRPPPKLSMAVEDMRKVEGKSWH